MKPAGEPRTAVWRASFALSDPLLRLGWRLDVKGLEHLPASGPVIVAGNHISYSDGPILVTAVGHKRLLRFLAKVEAFRVPVLGWYLRQVGVIPLDRGRGDVGAIRSAAAILKAGGCLGVFPEGTRGGSARGKKPKTGVAFLASLTGAVVVPARVVNTDRMILLKRVEIRFGPPLRYEGPADRAGLQAFAQAVMAKIFSL